MKILIILLALLSACSAKEEKAIEDFLEGELETGEKVIEDLSASSSNKRMPPICNFSF